MNEPLIKQKPTEDLKDQLGYFFGISLGIFLFILFFQPFGPVRPDINEKLLFNAGFGGITYLFLWTFRIFFLRLFPDITFLKNWNINASIVSYFLFLTFNTVAFVFYLRYVGPLMMTMYMVFKITLINLAPLFLLRTSDEYRSLKIMVQALLEKNKDLSMMITETNEKEKAVEVFTSDNKSDIIQLQIDDLILIKSADNYVEIVYKENDKIQQKLIRNTLKNIENQLKKYSEFIRCHRTSIVNKKFVLDFTHGYTGYRIKISGYGEEIPVSRQYLLHVKEAITTA